MAFKNYLLTAFRTLVNNPFYSLLTSAGLAVGIAASLMLLLYVNFENSYDRQSPVADRIYRVYNESSGNEGVIKDANSHSAIGPVLKSLYPEVTDYTRIYTMANRAQAARVDDHVFPLTKAYVVDPGFLRMFPFPAVTLDTATALSQPYSVVLTAALAQKYFGNQPALRKTIALYGHGMEGLYTVTGLMHDLPPNTHFDFQMLISYATKYSKGHVDNWENYWDYNYIQLREGANPKRIEEALDALGKQHIRSEALELKLQSLRDIHLTSDLTYELSANGDRRIVHSMLFIAMGILIVAWINYINLTTARAMVRAKEVGIRKILGAARKQLMLQFLLESALQNTVAIIFALALVQVGLPLFTMIVEKPITLNFSGPLSFWQLAVITYLLSIVISGLYPAFLLSSLHTAKSVRGTMKHGKEGAAFRRSLVVVQFAVSAILIAATFIIYRQMAFMLRQPLGISIDQTLVLQAPVTSERDSTFSAQITRLQQELNILSGVKAVSSSSVVPGQNLNTISGSSAGMWREGDTSEEKTQYYYFTVDEHFFPAFEVKFLGGKNFSAEGIDPRRHIIINRTALEAFGFYDAQEAIHKDLVYGSHRQHRLTIIGVVDNFAIQSVKERAAPMLYYYQPVSQNPLIAVKMASENVRLFLAQTERVWKKIFPDQPFTYNFLDQKFLEQYHAEKRFGLLFGLFSALGVVIACFGLFGLTAFSTLQRVKEIGIRKVLGASVTQIVTLFTRDLTRPTVIAFLLACPIIWYGAEQWLQQYATRIAINSMIFIVPFCIMVSLALLTVLFATLKPAKANPAEAIRTGE